jgi:hypothetical protein
MKLSAADFPNLQLSLLAALLMMLVGAGVGYAAFNSTQLAQRERAAAQAERNEFDGKLRRVSSEQSEIKQKSERFNALRARGVIGEEQRLEWVELLKAIRDQRRLLDLQYEFAPQRELDAKSDAKPDGNFTFFASTMKVQIKLLHEEDLTRFLADLSQQARALIQVKSCNVSRLQRDASENGSAAQLLADCQIDWITLRETAKK